MNTEQNQVRVVTDELFLVGREGVSAFLGFVSRFDCDVERLENEPGRICRFCSLYGEGLEREVPVSLWNRRLSQWFKYRYGLMLVAAQGERPIILDCHSFPSELSADVDIDLGYNDDGSRPPDEVIVVVTDIFQEAGYRVGVNRPYANAITPVGCRDHSLMIEINRRCYMDEMKLCKHEGFARRHECLEQVYSTLLKK